MIGRGSEDKMGIRYNKEDLGELRGDLDRLKGDIDNAAIRESTNERVHRVAETPKYAIFIQFYPPFH